MNIFRGQISVQAGEIKTKTPAEFAGADIVRFINKLNTWFDPSRKQTSLLQRLDYCRFGSCM